MGQELYSIQIAKKEEAARRAKQRAALMARRDAIQRSNDQPRSVRLGRIRARQTNVNVHPPSRAAINFPIRRPLPVEESVLGSELDSDDYGTEIDPDNYRYVEVDEDQFVEVDEDELIEVDEDELFVWEAMDDDSQSEYESEGLIEEAQLVMVGAVGRSPVVFRGVDQENSHTRR